MVNYYAGIGSRETPSDILEMMSNLANGLSQCKWTLRSGGANGADSAFEKGSQGNVELWLPFLGFNGRTNGWLPEQMHFDLAKELHPMWNRLSPMAKMLHARNVGQILGLDGSNPSKFVLCWTADGAETAKDYSRSTGGTGTAIKLASIMNIPVFNLKNGDWKSRLQLYFLELTSSQKSL